MLFALLEVANIKQRNQIEPNSHQRPIPFGSLLLLLRCSPMTKCFAIHPLTHHPSIHSSNHQFIYLNLHSSSIHTIHSIHPSIHPIINSFSNLSFIINSFIHPSFPPSIIIIIHIFIHPSNHQFIHSSTHPSFTPSIIIIMSIHSPIIHTFIQPSIHSSGPLFIINPYIHSSIHPSIIHSIHSFIHHPSMQPTLHS
jgi:hypothetical protein